jgi:NAD(P)-dependent dehydrogenase (short-subunit alcohol dehydrogenase family)
MQRTAFVTGADRGLGLALVTELAAKGWRVVAGQYMPSWPDLEALRRGREDQVHIVPLDVGSTESVQAAAARAAAVTPSLDLVINNAGIYGAASRRPLREPQDYPEMTLQYQVNALGPLRVVDALLALLDRGSLKRLCFVSSEAGSIGRSRRTDTYGYCMSKAALNMAVSIMFNHLRPEGYTFRLYHPGFMRTYMHGQKNMSALLEPDQAVVPALQCFLGEQDEEHLVLRDYQGQEYPW